MSWRGKLLVDIFASVTRTATSDASVSTASGISGQIVVTVVLPSSFLSVSKDVLTFFDNENKLL